jgi:hypothetical protein
MFNTLDPSTFDVQYHLGLGVGTVQTLSRPYLMNCWADRLGSLCFVDGGDVCIMCRVKLCTLGQN